MVTAAAGESSERSRRRRRSWSEDEKRSIVAKCEVPDSSVSIVARRHDVNANQLFTWRRQFKASAEAGDNQATFVPAVIAPEESIVDREAPAPFDDCVARLHEDFQMILCGVHFAESRMLDLLRVAKSDARSHAKPVLCYLDLPSQLSMTNF